VVERLFNMAATDGGRSGRRGGGLCAHEATPLDVHADEECPGTYSSAPDNDDTPSSLQYETRFSLIMLSSCENFKQIKELSF
jgi:hypothetical protein